MSYEELKEKFNEAVAYGGFLMTDLEKDALLGMYSSLRSNILLQGAGIEDEMVRIAGVLEFLQNVGHIQDDERFWMLMNELEAVIYA